MAASRIMIVDDDRVLGAILEDRLSASGYIPLRYEDGERALAAVRAAPPDLIILDYLLPGLDGAGVFQALHADPRLRAIPILVLTGVPHALPPLPGVAVVLGKPFDMAVLVETVRRLLASDVPA